MGKQEKNFLTEEEKSINLVDVFMYLLFYWKWYVLSILIFGGYFWYNYSKTPFIYSRAATVMIKTPANSQSTIRMNRYNSSSGQVNMANELLQFRSKELMRRVIDRLHAEVSYTVRDGLRQKELYTTAPVRILFLDAKPDEVLGVTVTPKSEKEVLLTDFSRGVGEKKTVNINDTVETVLGKIVVFAAGNYALDCWGKPVKVVKNSREGMVGFFLSNLSIKQMDGDAALLNITMNDLSPLRAADVLDMLISVYNEEAVEDKNRTAVNTAEFIKERLGIIEKELGSVETDIEVMKRESEWGDINTAAGMYVSDSRQYESLLKELETQLQLVNFIKMYLQDGSKADELIPSNIGLTDLNIENQIALYNETLLKRNRLVNGSGSNHPVVQELNRSIQAMKQNIFRAVDNLSASLALKEKDFSRQENVARQKVQTVPRKQREMLSVERQQTVKESLYIFLLNKREENALNQAMVDDNARIIDPASGGNAPVYPNRYKKLLIGVGCGVVIPTVVFLLMLILDTRVRSRKEIEDFVSAPFLAEVPQVEVKETEAKDIAVRVHGRDALSEAFRILRTNLGFMALQAQEQKVITLTSFNAGAGKTFVSVNLAASFAQTEKRVIILDLDLRKGSLSNIVHAKHVKGMAHYLSDSSVNINDIIMKNGFSEGLDMIPVGVIAPNPAELLLSKRLDELIAELRKRYDYVIIDNVPVGLVADATIVNRISDLTLFIVRAGKLDRRQLPELERLYLEHKLTNMSVVLNGVKKGSRGYGYGYGYGNESHSHNGKHKSLKNFFSRFLKRS